MKTYYVKAVFTVEETLHDFGPSPTVITNGKITEEWQEPFRESEDDDE